MANQENLILVELKERVLTITLNRPEAKNALAREMTVQLHEILTEASTNPDVGAIVLTGAGSAFCAGGDVKQMSSAETSDYQVSREQLLIYGAEASMLLHEMPKPTIAMMRGAAAGAGLSLAAGCDLRFAVPTAKITFAYANIGLSGDFAACYLVQHWLGPAKAREFCLLCPVIDANEAQEIGLISKVIPQEELEDYTYSVARALANGPTSALSKIKQNLNSSQHMSVAESIALERENFLICRESPEHKEAIKAFVEKRKPVFH